MSGSGHTLGATVSWRELLDEAERRLHGVEDDTCARREARWIVEEVLGLDGADFSTVLDEPATIRGVSRLDQLIERRLAGEPIQYVLGHWPFRTLDLLVDRRVLIPRPETEVVAGLAIEELDRLRPGEVGTVVDLGTGSGAIGLAVAAERPGTRVVLTDVSEQALAVARANLAGLGVVAGSVEIATGTWFDALPKRLLGECDVVVSNPPYVHTGDALPGSVVEWEPESALLSGTDGMNDLRQLVSGASQWLRPAGALVLEMDPRQTRAIAELAESQGFTARVRADLAGRDRAVVARRS